MSKPRETGVWKFLEGAKKVLPRLHMERVENGLSAGMFDVNGCFYGVEFWLELKAAERPAKIETPVRFCTRDLQVQWGQDRVEAGGRAAYLLMIGASTPKAGHTTIPRAFFVIPAWHGALIHEGCNEHTLRNMSLINWPNPSPANVIAATLQCRKEF